MKIDWGDEHIENKDEIKNEKAPSKEEISEILTDIQRLASSENVFDYCSSHDVYEYLKENLDTAYISEVHVFDKELGKTFFVVAKDKDSYDKYESKVEHQHHPDVVVDF